MKTITVRTTAHEQMMNITSDIQDAVTSFAQHTKACLVYCPHTTAGVTVNECADPDVALDLQEALHDMEPAGTAWRHAEGNSPAHLKASLVGSSAMILVEEGRPKLGRWQGVFLCEFDGPRTREIWVQALSCTP